MKRAFLFVDGGNIFYSLKKLNTKIDYESLLHFLEQQVQVKKAFYYLPSNGSDDEANFISKMYKIGYKMVVKPVKKTPHYTFLEDGRGGETVIMDGDMDVELAVDAISYQYDYDIAIICSGDQDYSPVVKRLQEDGKKVYVISSHALLSGKLASIADKVIYLEDILPSIRLSQLRVS